MENKIAEEAVEEFKYLEGDRSNFDSHCREVAEKFLPNEKHLFASHGSVRTKGEKRSNSLFDSTGAIALSRFASILDSLLTPRSQTWHRITASDPQLQKYREVKQWFEEVNRLLFKYRYAPYANFASQNSQNYRSLGAYGNGCVFIDELRTSEPGLRYKNVHISECYFAENHQGIIDKLYRPIQLTTRQVKQQFGPRTPKKIEAEKQIEKEWLFLHCVKPREEVQTSRLDYRGMPFASYYILVEDRELVTEGGYTSFPYATSRYEQSPGEVYGRSPAMFVLPSAKTLDEQKKVMLKQGHRALDPVLLTHDDGVIDGFSMRPGAINAGGVTPDGRPLVHVLPTGNFAIGKEMMDEEKSLINDAFLITLFQIMTENPQMTATEVLERTKEKGFLLAPTIGRQQSEYLGPMIEREVDVLSRQRLLPKMPPVLQEAGGRYKVEYESPLSRTQRAEEAVGLMRTVEPIMNVINITQDPSLLDFINFEVAMKEVAEIQGMPLRWTNSEEAIAAIREQRAKQRDQQTMIQAAPGAAAMTKAIAKVAE